MSNELQKNRFVMPGEYIGTTEEFLSGEGTYEEGGKIFATNVGMLELSNKEMKIKVKPVTDVPVVLGVGDVVIGVVDSVRESMAIIDVVKVADKKRAITGDAEATLHVSEISKEYVDDLKRELHNRDIIRAKVIQAKPSIQLSIKDPNLGILKTICLRCYGPLIKKEQILHCPVCKYTEKRKIADDYGMGKI
ncbi:MAG: exosome complex RNA-binding protein Csl4 [Thermoplasmata archaeon]